MNEATQYSPRPALAAVPLSSPWTRRTWDAGSGTRSWVTASCSRCGAFPWDEPLGMLAAFPSIEQAREELPRDWGWAVTTLPGGADQVLCPACAARPAP